MESRQCKEPNSSNMKEKEVGRERWTNKADGIITLLAYTVGEGTVLKFPYLCARNGGGAFLVPFLIFTVLCAWPIYYLELLIGQYFQRGPISVWKMCPSLKGLGLGSTLVSLVYASYTSAYFSWYAYYLIFSFFPVLPWSNCDNTWNTNHCFTALSAASNITTNSSKVSSGFSSNHTDSKTSTQSYSDFNMTDVYTLAPHVDSFRASSAEEFWRLNVLELTDGFGAVGNLRWPLVGLLVLAFFCMFLILFKSLQITGKIVYITFFCPIILITILFIRALTLPGATDGLLYYIKPEFEKLKDLKIWMEACAFSLYSMGTGTGCIITVASHNKFRTNCLSQSLILVFGDALITIYCGFAIFSFLGHLAWVKDVTLEHFQSGGFNIAFMVFPEAVTYLPLPQLWSAILFITFMTLGLDTTVPSFEVVISVISDKYPRLAKRRWFLVAMVMLPLFLLGLLFVTQGGIYFLILVDWYSFAPSVMIFGIVQTLVLTWVCGVTRLDKYAVEMYDQPLPWILKIFIKFVTPFLLVAIFSYAMYDYRPPKYGDYVYPTWATAVGWIITLLIVLPMPVWICYSVWKAKGDTFFQKIKSAVTPTEVGRVKDKDINEVEDSLL